MKRVNTVGIMVALVLSLLALTGLQSLPARQIYMPLHLRSYPPVTPTPEQPSEELFGIRVDEKGIVFQVQSGGCTQKGNFEVRILESEPLQVLLVRTRPDPCDGLVPYGEKIPFSYQELGLVEGARFIVINPRKVVTVVRWSEHP
jgi:hypothetical protein